MKTSWLAVLLVSSASLRGGARINNDSDYVVAQRSAHENVWIGVSWGTNQFGQLEAKTNSFREIATGLNYWNQRSKQWEESKEEIVAYPGGAAATSGQHQVIFSSDLAASGAIDLQISGKRFQSRILGLSYQDLVTGSNVLIAELKSSVPGVIVPPNQVLYANAFDSINADVLYTYTKAGFEQDIILRQRPPLPEVFGLNSLSSVLQVLTEFESAPTPVVKSAMALAGTVFALPDQRLDFGPLTIGAGKAFTIGHDPLSGISVSKEWTTLEGRTFLVEQIPVAAIAERLDKLPLPKQASLKPAKGSVKYVVSAKRLLPSRKLAQTGKREMKMASLSPRSPGFVLDYTMLNSSLTNYTFQGDATYYVSGSLNLYSNVTFEGGAVIKYTNNASLNFPSTITLNWLTDAYRPVVLTSKDDDSVGDIISGSTGNPTTNYYANPALNFNGSSATQSISNLRISFAQQAIFSSITALSITNCQIVSCSNGIPLAAGTVRLRNSLLSKTLTDLIGFGGATFDVQNTTFSETTYLATGQTVDTLNSASFTNCILAMVTNNSLAIITLAGNYNGFYLSSPFGTVQSTNTFYPFQTVGAGNYYLTNGCAFLNTGTTNLDSTLLASLKTRTTYPPVVLSNITVSIDTVLNPQVQRDTDQPDLGYHYDPIDVIPSTYAITNAALTVSAGTVLGFYQDSAGIWLQEGSSLFSSGTATAPVRLVRYNTVQEQPIKIGLFPLNGIMVNPYHTGVSAPSANFRFSKLSSLAAGEYHFYHANGNWAYTNLVVQDCESWSGKNYFGGTTNSTAVIRNTLFHRGMVNAANYVNSTNVTLALSNNLIWNPNANLQIVAGANTNLWFFFNNVFDTCTFGIIGGQSMNDYNGYINCNKQLNPTNAHNIVLSSFTYAKGPLGDYYQVSTNFLDRGSTTADLAGLFHYTVLTNLVGGIEIKETNSIVDIGLHYVATDGTTTPLDTDSDGFPDYLEDVNGNGSVDTGETDWQSAIDLGLKVWITRPKNNSIIP